MHRHPFRTRGRFGIRVKCGHKGFRWQKNIVHQCFRVAVQSRPVIWPPPCFRQFIRVSRNGPADGHQKGTCFQWDRKQCPASRKVSLPGQSRIQPSFGLWPHFTRIPNLPQGDPEERAGRRRRGERRVFQIILGRRAGVRSSPRQKPNHYLDLSGVMGLA